MEFKSVPTTSTSATVLPGSAERKPCNIFCTPTRTPHDVPGNDAKKLPMMICRRTPLRTPSTSFNREYFSRKDDETPMKRCFSQEVFELSRHHIIVSKRSKVGISMLPPKRKRLDDFNCASSTSKINRQHCIPCSSSTSQIISREEKTFKQIVTQPSRASLSRIEGKPKENRPQNGIDGMRIPIPIANTTSTSMVLKRNESQGTSYFIVSVKNFPLNEWKERNYDVEMLREMMFLSDVKAAPVSLIQKDDELIIKFTNAAEANFITERSQHTRKRMVLYEILKSPFTLTFKALSGVVRWIVGN